MDQSNQKQKASNGDFLSILSDMHADLYEEAHLTRAEMRSQIEHFARQTFRPPVSTMMGSTCTVRVLAFWNLLSEAFETLRNGWGEPSSPFYNGCPYWKLGTVRNCKLCCDGGHCPRHIDCDHCAIHAADADYRRFRHELRSDAAAEGPGRLLDYRGRNGGDGRGAAVLLPSQALSGGPGAGTGASRYPAQAIKNAPRGVFE